MAKANPRPLIHSKLPTQSLPIKSRNVAVIGAGAAGLVAARELRREGHKVVVLEREKQIGGTWIYTNRIESDPLGLDPDRSVIHSSLYRSLRTNLPREVMGYLDYPFVARDDGSRDPRRFPGHGEVLKYLKDFVSEFGIEEIVRFESEVVNVGLMENNKWKVRSKMRNNGYHIFHDEIYDAVVVCNGHYTQPRIAEIPGTDLWPGKQMHSHNFRIPEPFRDQVVILIGNAASAADICMDLAGVAKEVHVASRSVADETYEKQPGYDNMWLQSMIESVHKDGTVVFRNGNAVLADVIMHCTGYKYHFPFLETNGIVTVDDNRVGPLYQHIFPLALAPWLSFVGLPWKVVPFPLCELQSKMIAGALSGRIVLPSQEEMMEEVKAFYSTLEASGTPKRYTHNMEDYQFDYDNWLAEQCGYPAIEEWRVKMYSAVSKSKRIRRETYRDEWDDHHLVLQAQEDFVKYTSNRVVILIGNSASTSDIKRGMAGDVKEVDVGARSVADETYEKQPGYDNMWLHSMIERANEDGTVVFRNGRIIFADVILHCTGLVPVAFLCWDTTEGSTLLNSTFQFSGTGSVLSGQIVLPSEEEVMEDVKACKTFYSTLEASGKPK